MNNINNDHKRSAVQIFLSEFLYLIETVILSKNTKYNKFHDIKWDVIKDT